MIVDRRKDNYDELQILAGDTRNRRRRANLWTTGLIAGGMILAGAFVSTVNEQTEALGETGKDLADTKLRLAAAENQSAVLTAEKEYFRQNAIWFSSFVADMDLSDAVRDLEFVVPTVDGQPVTEVRMTNVVWALDGSRRFPITDGDIVWIPEADFWVQLESKDSLDPVDPTDPLDPDRTLREVTLYHDENPPSSESVGREYFLGGGNRYYEEVPTWSPGSRGTANCVQLTLHYNSRRPGFSATKYLDMEVLLYNNEDCAANGPVTPPP